MRFSLLTPLLTGAAFLVVLSPRASVSASPSLQAIVAGLDTTSPVLAEANVKLAVARAAYTSGRAWPNPALFAESENLGGRGASETEQTFGVQQRLGFLWSQSATTMARKLAYETERAAYEEMRRELVVQVVQLVARYHNIAQQSVLLDTVLSATQRTQEAMEARRREGDVSEYDAKRLHAERIQLELRRIELIEEMNRTAAGFVQATGQSATVLAGLLTPGLPAPAMASVEEAVQLAMAQRPVLQARAQHVQATQVAHRAAKWNQLPDLSVGIGRKEADTDLSGWVWKADLEIPLWGQRRSERHLARVEHERAAAVYRAAQLEAEQDARAAFAEWSSLSEAALLTESFGREDAEVSVNRGIELHASGEFSAAELVDALRSSLDALAANLDLQTALLSANLKLRFVTGLPILEE